MISKLGGKRVHVHVTSELDVGHFRDWSQDPAHRLLGLDVEGLAFDHEDQINHFGPLAARWTRLVQLGGTGDGWVFDPSVKTHRAALEQAFSDPWRQWVTWGTFDPEAIYATFQIDITPSYYDAMQLANLLRPGPLESHKLKEWAFRLDMPELRQAEDRLDARAKELEVPAPRKPVRPRLRKAESQDQYAERLFQWRTTALVQWQLAVQSYYEHYPLREDARLNSTGGYKMGWSKWRDIPRDDKAYQEYAGLDPVAARLAWPELVRMCKERGVYRPLATELPLTQSMVRVKRKGVLTDGQYARAKLDEAEPIHLAAKASFLELTGVKASSSKRVDWLRERQFPFNPRAVTKDKYGKSTTNPSLSGQHIKDYLAKHAPLDGTTEPQGVSSEVYRALELIKAAGETQNLVTFLNGLVKMTDPAGRLHPSFNTLGAKTGRWTAGKPAVQTFSNKNGTRGIIIPDPGEVLVSFDLKQIEVRVFAALSKCAPLIEAFNRGDDIYGIVAKRLFGAQWTKRDRAIVKRIILGGCLFGGGPGMMQTQLHDLDGYVVPIESISDTRARFYQEYPEGKRFIRGNMSPDDVWLDSGRFVPGDPDKEYKVTNSKCQGNARDILVNALLDSFKKGYESSLRLVVHDEGIYSLPLEGLEASLMDIRSSFEQPYHDVQVGSDVELYPERWGGRMLSWEGPGRWTANGVTYSTYQEALTLAA